MLPLSLATFLIGLATAGSPPTALMARNQTMDLSSVKITGQPLQGLNATANTCASVCARAGAQCSGYSVRTFEVRNVMSQPGTSKPPTVRVQSTTKTCTLFTGSVTLQPGGDKVLSSAVTYGGSRGRNKRQEVERFDSGLIVRTDARNLASWLADRVGDDDVRGVASLFTKVDSYLQGGRVKRETGNRLKFNDLDLLSTVTSSNVDECRATCVGDARCQGISYKSSAKSCMTFRRSDFVEFGKSSRWQKETFVTEAVRGRPSPTGKTFGEDGITKAVAVTWTGDFEQIARRNKRQLKCEIQREHMGQVTKTTIDVDGYKNLIGSVAPYQLKCWSGYRWMKWLDGGDGRVPEGRDAGIFAGSTNGARTAVVNVQCNNTHCTTVQTNASSVPKDPTFRVAFQSHYKSRGVSSRVPVSCQLKKGTKTLSTATIQYQGSRMINREVRVTNYEDASTVTCKVNHRTVPTSVAGGSIRWSQLLGNDRRIQAECSERSCQVKVTTPLRG